jgi:hypothetical protein
MMRHHIKKLEGGSNRLQETRDKKNKAINLE